MSTRQATLVGLFALVVVGCGAEDDRPAVWSYVSPVIMEPSCATVSCHSKAAAVAGIDLSDPDVGYKSLLELTLILHPGDEDKEKVVPRPMVVPYHPESSRIINMMRANGAERMPPDRPLAEADIALVEKWILLGAKK